jgi:hypothetical protein
MKNIAAAVARAFYAAHPGDFVQVTDHPKYGNTLGAYDKSTGLWVIGPDAIRMMEEKLEAFIKTLPDPVDLKHGS